MKKCSMKIWKIWELDTLGAQIAIASCYNNTSLSSNHKRSKWFLQNGGFKYIKEYTHTPFQPFNISLRVWQKVVTQQGQIQCKENAVMLKKNLSIYSKIILKADAFIKTSWMIIIKVNVWHYMNTLRQI